MKSRFAKFGVSLAVLLFAAVPSVHGDITEIIQGVGIDGNSGTVQGKGLVWSGGGATLDTNYSSGTVFTGTVSGIDFGTRPGNTGTVDISFDLVVSGTASGNPNDVRFNDGGWSVTTGTLSYLGLDISPGGGPETFTYSITNLGFANDTSPQGAFKEVQSASITALEIDFFDTNPVTGTDIDGIDPGSSTDGLYAAGGGSSTIINSGSNASGGAGGQAKLRVGGMSVNFVIVYVPEPSAFAIGTLGLIGLSFRRRR